nr:putative transporter [Quercus suber]
MPEDIHASTGQFSTAVSIFYATYVAFETPWAVLLKTLTPRFLLAGLSVVWSLTTIFSGFIASPGGLYAARLILGACEGGLFPALNIYLTMIYRREEMAKRVSYLFVCAAISGAFGIVSLVVGIIVWFGLPNDPSNAYFLTTEQKQMMKVRDAERASYMGSEDFSWMEIQIACRDPKVYLSGIIQFLQDILLYGFSTFLPSIIKSMGYSTLQAQYLTIPVYVTGGLAFVLIAWISDRLSVRGPFLWLANSFGIVGYTLILCPTSHGVKYLGTFLCAIAVYSGPGINLAWLNVNMAPHYRRATAVGLQQTIGNTAGIVAGQIYRTSPYVLGNSFSLGALCLSQVVIAVEWFYLRRLNEEKRKILAGEIEDRRKDPRKGIKRLISTTIYSQATANEVATDDISCLYVSDSKNISMFGMDAAHMPQCMY